MELLGEKFKSVRISKGISLDKAEEETRISKQYLEALENNEFDRFPGETYISGFIRNYSDFLGLNQEEMLSKYKNMKIQEMPTPVEELLSNKKPFPIFKVGIAALILCIVVVIGLAGTVIVENYSSKNTGEHISRKIDSNSSIIEFNGQFLEQNFIEGNKISFLLENNDMYIVTVSKIFHDSVLFSSEFGSGKIEKEVPIKLNSSDVIDFNEDTTADIKIIIKTISEDKTSAQIRFDKAITDSKVDITPTVEEVKDAQNIIKPVVEDIIEKEKLDADDLKSLIVISTSNKIDPFYLSITFRERCLIQYKIDGEENYNEGYFSPGKLLRIDANKKINIALSNAGAAYASLNGKEINLGDFGSVASKEISWRLNSANRYELYIRNNK